MAQTLILIDVDVQTGNIAIITHPDDDSQILNHPPQLGFLRIQAPRGLFPIDPVTGRANCGLKQVADYVQQVTGRRPPNG